VTLDLIKLCARTAGPGQSFAFQTKTEEETLRCYENELERAIRIFGKEDRQSMRIAYLVAEMMWSMCDAPDIVAGQRNPMPLLKRADNLLGDIIKWLVPRKQVDKEKKKIEEMRRSIEDDLERQVRVEQVAQKRPGGGASVGTKVKKRRKLA
jgi:hypothetical protein